MIASQPPEVYADEPIKAIETNYAGCRFRSRLEARWAVALDYLGIRWEYEPQGFIVSDRLGLVPDPPDATWPYLPDFWLPDLSIWVEVKGSLTGAESLEFIDSAASLSWDTGCDVVLLGPIPRPDRRSTWPVKLHMDEKALVYRGWAFGLWDQPAMEYPNLMAEEGGVVHFGALEYLIGGWPEKLNPKMAGAYRAARSARFEHGEVGAP